MKKGFIAIIAICVCIWGCQKTRHRSPDHITLTWTGDPHTTQTIEWRTDPKEKNGEVQFMETEDSVNFENAVKLEQDSSGVFKTDAGTWNFHMVTITGLKPGKTYCYRVGHGDNLSNKKTFKTEPQNTGNFSFLIFGDSQSGEPNNPDYNKFDITIHNAFRANPDVRFFINMGDLVETGGYYTHWDHWFEAAKDIIDQIPAMPVVGNHETYVDSAEIMTTKPNYFIRQFKLPQNGPDGLKGQVYSYDYGDVHFVVWDSQIEEEHLQNTLINKDTAWLANDLKNSSKTWKILMFHKPPYYNKQERSNDELFALVQPIIDRYHVDLVLNGHDHTISSTFPVKGDVFSEKPSEGTIYYVAGRSGKKFYKDIAMKVWNSFPSNMEELSRCNDTLQPDYVVAEVNAGDSTFTLKAYKQDGTPVDMCIIDKKKDAVIHGTVRIKAPEKFREPILVFYGIKDAVIKPQQNDQGVWLIPADRICKKFGIKYKYDKSTNMLLFSKDN